MQREKEKFPSSKYLKLLSDTGIFVIGNFLAKLILYFMLPFYTSVMTAEVYGTAELLNNLSDMLFLLDTVNWRSSFPFCCRSRPESECTFV